MILNFIRRHRLTILYGAALALMLILLKWLELRFIIMHYAIEVYVGAIALIFTLLGVWVALKLARPKVETRFVEREVYVGSPIEFTVNQQELEKLGLSRRELEVLQLMAEGLSNQEIASSLFVSLNTIKTHTSKLFEKMDVKRRTQAVELGRRLSIIPPHTHTKG